MSSPACKNEKKKEEINKQTKRGTADVFSLGTLISHQVLNTSWSIPLNPSVWYLQVQADLNLAPVTPSSANFCQRGREMLATNTTLTMCNGNVFGAPSIWLSQLFSPCSQCLSAVLWSFIAFHGAGKLARGAHRTWKLDSKHALNSEWNNKLPRTTFQINDYAVFQEQQQSLSHSFSI